MFGYITPLACELKVREYELYRAYYCGLCKALATEYHKSVVLNFDCTFLFILEDGLRNEGTEAVPCRCALHPVRGRRKVVSGCASHAAAVNVLMAAAKLEDDVTDGKRGARLGRLLFARARQKAARALPALERATAETVQRLHEIERGGGADTDAAADTYARLLGGLMEDMDVLQSHILFDLGYHLGRWTYLIDAYDDIGDDLATGNYNVFTAKYGKDMRGDGAAKKEIEFGLVYTLSRAADALRRLKLKKNRGILENIVCLGLRERTRNVLSGADYLDKRQWWNAHDLNSM